MDRQAIRSGTLEIGLITRAGRVSTGAFDPATREMEVVWSTGAGVLTQPYQPPYFDEPFIEELSLDPQHVRLDFFNSGRAPLLNVHQRYSWEDQVGTVLQGSARIDAGRGLARTRVFGRDSLAELRSDLAEHQPNLSIGYEVYRYRDITGPDDPQRRLLAVDWAPIELSLAPVPADLGAHGGRSADGKQRNLCTLEVRTTTQGAATMEPDEVLENEGDGANEPAGGQGTAGSSNQPATSVVVEEPAAEGGETPGAQPEVEGEAGGERAAAELATRAATAERERILTVDRLCQQHGVADSMIGVRNRRTNTTRQVNLGEYLRTSGVPVTRAREIIMEQLRHRDSAAPTNGRVSVGRSGEQDVGAAVENALQHRLRLRTRGQDGRLSDVVQLTEQGRQYRNLSLLEIARDLLGRAGVSHRTMSRAEVAERALHQRAPGMGTASFPEILANVASKVLLESYEAAPSTYQRIGRRRDHTDFKPRKIAKMGNVPELKLIGESGEVTYGKMGEGSEAISLKTYGRIVAFTREAMINDDLGALDDIPRDFGQEAMHNENVLAWALVTGNVVLGDGVALYHASHGNLGTGGGSALSETSLSAARTALRRQVGIPRTDDLGNIIEAGRQLNLAPGWLIVPPELETTGRKLLASTTPNAAADVQVFTEFEGMLVEAQLSSAIEWYVNAARRPLFQYGYLDGQGGPMIDTRLGFTNTGVELRCLHDFTVGVEDHRPTYKAAGA